MSDSNPKDFISTQEWCLESLHEVLRLTADIKHNPEKYSDSLRRKSLCLFFYNPSTRTRNSMEVGIAQMGGFAVFNDARTNWVGYRSESVKDAATVLGRYYDLIGIRMFPNVVNWKYGECNRILREYGRYARCPVINLEDDLYHPCQAMTDIFTIRERFGENLSGRKIVISWAYHPKPLPLSVPDSITLISTRFGMDVTLACPEGFELPETILNTARKNVEAAGGSFEIEHDIKKAYEGADVVYVKSWGSPKAYGNPREEKKMRLPYRDTWICNTELMDLTSAHSIFMHCLPVRRNIVVTDEVIDGPKSAVYDQAENRLYTQKALMYFMLVKSR